MAESGRCGESCGDAGGSGLSGAAFRGLENATGALCWEWDAELGRGTALAVDGQLILLGEHGRLASLALDANAPRVQALTDGPLFAGPCFSAPEVHRGRLYLRNEAELL